MNSLHITLRLLWLVVHDPLLVATSQTAVGLTVAPSTTQDPPKYLPVFWNKAFGLEYKPKNSSLVLTEAAPATNLRRGSLGCRGRVPH